MDSPGKTRSNRRSVQSETTRTVILDAAEHLMLERGYIGASLAAIAADAGVVVQTIYNSVGSKADVLAAVLERGATEPVSEAVPARENPRSAQRVPGGPRSATDIIRLLVDWCVETNVRTAALRRVVGQAAGIDADVARLEVRDSARLLHNFSETATALRDRNALRSGLSDHEAAAAIWALAHPQVYRSLVLDLDWSLGAYREWLGNTLRAALF
ncbi:TetR/AcrR family transcriptional regulator [Cryobacterium zhongshanensis]|uniref:TetR/AcrR family transcriptional regulator n=1 Tax=Cryobacterium zhongshanensis TaxID=2928153 RepID=A0AA41UF52_9MICO|nr:TetR/AcrR family transcriptional regulator [Cryobacterium zhongshanensis]MCI4657650.1 TetR/AcrR family transcriptional regulator [Cryobacterium zhongshanensis]